MFFSQTLAGLQGKEQGGDLFARTKPAPRQKAPQQALGKSCFIYLR